MQRNASAAVDAGHARTHIVRLRTSDRAALASAGGLERAAELPLPASQLVCALAGPLGDFAYFATATVPAQLYKLSVGAHPNPNPNPTPNPNPNPTPNPTTNPTPTLNPFPKS